MYTSKGAIGLSFFLPIFILIFFLKHQAEASILLIPSLVVSEEYNDNFHFREDEEEDFTTRLSPILTLQYANAHIVLAVNYRGNATLYVKNKEANGYLQSLSFDIVLPSLSRTLGGIDIEITEAIDVIDELSAIPIGAAAQETFRVTGGRADATRNRFTLTVGYPWTSLHKTVLTYSNTLVRYQDQTAGISDFILNGVDIRETVALSYRAGLNAGYGVSATDFKNGSQFTVHRTSLGGQYHINSFFLVYGDLGASFISGDSRLNSEIGMSNLLEKPQLKMGYIRRVMTREGSSALLNRQVLFAEAAYSFNTNTVMVLRLDHSQEDGILGVFGKTLYDSAILTGRTRFLSWLDGSLSYSFLRRQEMDVPIPTDVKSNRISMLLTASDPGWKLLD